MLRKILRKVASRQGSTTKNTILIVAANLGRLLAQALYFVAFARSVGPNQFAHFASAIALAVIMAPFIGLGSGALIVKNCSRDSTRLPAYYGNALFFTSTTILIATPLYLFLIGKSAGHQWATVGVAVLIAELVFTKIQEITTQAFQSQGKMQLVATATLLSSTSRIIAAALGYFLAGDNLNTWLVLYIASALVPCAIVQAIFLKSYEVTRAAHFSEVFEGLKFSIGISSQGIYNDADKLILPRYSTDAIAGNYAAAYKIVDVAFSPIRALLTVTYAGFFKAGSGGIGPSLSYAHSYLPSTLALGMAGTAGVFLCSSLAPMILGAGYEETATVLKYLAIIPLLRAFHFLIADALTGADYQGIRSCIQVTIAALNVGFNVLLIPTLGWRGAAFTSVACDLILCILLYGTAIYLKKREGNVNGHHA